MNQKDLKQAKRMILTGIRKQDFKELNKMTKQDFKEKLYSQIYIIEKLNDKLANNYTKPNIISNIRNLIFQEIHKLKVIIIKSD